MEWLSVLEMTYTESPLQRITRNHTVAVPMTSAMWNRSALASAALRSDRDSAPPGPRPSGHRAGPDSDLRSSPLRGGNPLRGFRPILQVSHAVRAPARRLADLEPPLRLRCGRMVTRPLLGLALRVIALRATVGLRSCFVLIASGHSAP